VIPEIYELVLLVLIAYRAWRFIAEDDILERPRRWLVRLPYGWKEGDPLPKAYREKLALFINCPWCAGAWVSLLIYIIWMPTLGQWPDSAGDVAVGIGVWFAISSSVGLIRSTLDPPEE
jgi:hypothetical protein